MYDIVLSFVTAFMVTFLAIPAIIKVAKKRKLYDEPDERKSHTSNIPTLGGIGIFGGVIFSIVLWTPFTVFGDLQYILCAFIIIFLIGAKDDIDPISPYTKLLGQIITAVILVVKANVKLTSLYGIFGVYEISEFSAVLLSVFTILVIINSFNLIDGINGLSGSIGTLISLVLGSWFFAVDRIDLAIVAFSLAGSIIAFLKYNFTPAKIFMGDTGSLLIGSVCAILAIKFIEVNNGLGSSPFLVKSVPSVAIGILILPLFDTLRVFITRLLRGKSPLYPDRTHIHHLLLDAGLSHMKATGLLVGVNVCFIILVYYFQNIGTLNLLLLIMVLAVMLSTILYFISKQRKIQAS